jgi:hypothetical protein
VAYTYPASDYSLFSTNLPGPVYELANFFHTGLRFTTVRREGLGRFQEDLVDPIL